MYRPVELYRRAKRIHQAEGLMPLLNQGVGFVIGRLFEHTTFYVNETSTKTIHKLNEGGLIPRNGNFMIKTVSSNQEADELEAKGFQFRSYVLNASERLDSGAIAFCIFIGLELANIGWIATTQKAQDSLNEPPVKVDYSNGEIYRGGSWTHPKYRGRGFHSYNLLKRMQFSLQLGKVLCRSVVEKRNIATQKAAAKVGTKICTEGRYLKILWWRSWKERPLEQMPPATKSDSG